MRKNPRRILSPQRLPFRHPGEVFRIMYLNDFGNPVILPTVLFCSQFFPLLLQDLGPK